MSRKLGLLLVVFLVIVPLVMTACGGDDKKDNAKAADLKQEFKSTTGITVKYPDGWAAQDGDAGVEIANKAEYLTLTGSTEIPAGAVAVIIMQPFDPSAMGLSADASVKDVVTTIAGSMSGESGSAKAGDAKDVKVGGKDGVRVDVSDAPNKSEGFFIGFKVDDKNMVIAIVAAHSGELNKNEATALKMLDSITYTAPAP